MTSTQIAQLNGGYQSMYLQQQQMSSSLSSRAPGYGNSYSGGNMSAGSGMAGGMMNAATSMAPMGMAGASMLGIDPLGMGLSAGMSAYAGGAGIAGAGLAAGAVALPAYAGFKAMEYGAGQISTGMQQQQQFGMMMQGAYGHRVQPMGGTGFSRNEMGSMSSTMRQMTTQQGDMGQMVGFEELGRLAANMGRMGMDQGVRDAKEFKDRFKKMVTTIKSIAEDMGTSLEEAQKMMVGMRSSGVFGMKNQAATATSIRQNAMASGLATSEITGMMGVGSQISRMIGGRGQAGAQGGMQAITNLGIAGKLGIVSEEDIYNVTGQTGAEGRRAMATQQLQGSAQFLRGRMGRRIVAAMAGIDGQLNEDAVDRFMRGGVGVNETMQMAGKNLAGVGRGNFVRNEGRIRGEIMGKFGGMMPAIAMRGWLGQKGIDPDSDRAMIFAQQRLGMGTDEAEQLMKMVKNLPTIMRESGYAAGDAAAQRQVAVAKEHSGLKGIKHKIDAAKAKIDAHLQEMGGSMMDYASEKADRLINAVTGQTATIMEKDTMRKYTRAIGGDKNVMSGYFGGYATMAGAGTLDYRASAKGFRGRGADGSSVSKQAGNMLDDLAGSKYTGGSGSILDKAFSVYSGTAALGGLARAGKGQMDVIGAGMGVVEKARASISEATGVDPVGLLGAGASVVGTIHKNWKAGNAKDSIQTRIEKNNAQMNLNTLLGGGSDSQSVAFGEQQREGLGYALAMGRLDGDSVAARQKNFKEYLRTSGDEELYSRYGGASAEERSKMMAGAYRGAGGDVLAAEENRLRKEGKGSSAAYDFSGSFLTAADREEAIGTHMLAGASSIAGRKSWTDKQKQHIGKTMDRNADLFTRMLSKDKDTRDFASRGNLKALTALKSRLGGDELKGNERAEAEAELFARQSMAITGDVAGVYEEFGSGRQGPQRDAAFKDLQKRYGIGKEEAIRMAQKSGGVIRAGQDRHVRQTTELARKRATGALGDLGGLVVKGEGGKLSVIGAGAKLGDDSKEYLKSMYQFTSIEAGYHGTDDQRRAQMGQAQDAYAAMGEAGAGLKDPKEVARALRGVGQYDAASRVLADTETTKSFEKSAKNTGGAIGDVMERLGGKGKGNAFQAKMWQLRHAKTPEAKNKIMTGLTEDLVKSIGLQFGEGEGQVSEEKRKQLQATLQQGGDLGLGKGTAAGLTGSLRQAQGSLHDTLTKKSLEDDKAKNPLMKEVHTALMGIKTNTAKNPEIGDALGKGLAQIASALVKTKKEQKECFPAGVRVAVSTTEDKAIEDVKSGDTILGAGLLDGEAKLLLVRVKEVRKHVMATPFPMFQIGPVPVTGNHPLFSTDTVLAQDVKSGDKLMMKSASSVGRVAVEVSSWMSTEDTVYHVVPEKPAVAYFVNDVLVGG